MRLVLILLIAACFAGCDNAEKRLDDIKIVRHRSGLCFAVVPNGSTYLPPTLVPCPTASGIDEDQLVVPEKP
jgi:hypothetical protein